MKHFLKLPNLVHIVFFEMLTCLHLEIVGRLGEMPATLPDWKWYCDLDKVAPRPRWFLDVEGYLWAAAKKLMAR